MKLTGAPAGFPCQRKNAGDARDLTIAIGVYMGGWFGRVSSTSHLISLTSGTNFSCRWMPGNVGTCICIRNPSLRGRPASRSSCRCPIARWRSLSGSSWHSFPLGSRLYHPFPPDPTPRFLSQGYTRGSSPRMSASPSAVPELGSPTRVNGCGGRGRSGATGSESMS